MRNASSTILKCLNSLIIQDYPIREIIVVDNVSKDNSRELVSAFGKESPVLLKLLKQKEDHGVASSLNRGTRISKSQLIVFMTADSQLPNKSELSKLVTTLYDNPDAVAAYATSILPHFIWDKYNFWEKYYSARMVDNMSSEMILKFDCVRKTVFQKIGGFDEKNYGENNIGGEDADMTTRLRHQGKILRSKAIAYHLHYLSDDYELLNVLRSRKMYARSYGRFLRTSATRDIRASCLFLLRPILAISPIFPSFFNYGLLMIILYSYIYTRKMLVTKSTLLNARITLIPLINIFLLYYELYWMAEAFFTYNSKK